MKRYFVQVYGAGCTLAVERHLFSFIREKYEYTLIPENFIPVLVEDIEREQRAYFLEHRGNSVQVSASPQGEGMHHRFVSAGDVNMTLIEVRREF